MNRFMMTALGFKHNFADVALSRSYFRAQNPTAGTGIASLDAATSVSTTSGILSVYNAATAAQGNVIQPVRLRLRATAVNTTASDGRIAIYTDTIDRYTSGGTAITETACINSGEGSAFVAPTSKATIRFGALTTPAATAEVKIVDRLVISTILAAGDVIDCFFGGAAEMFGDTGTGHPDTIAHLFPPVWIRPLSSMVVWWYGTAQAADPAFEFEFDYLETPNQN